MKKYYLGLAFFGLVAEIVVAFGITGLNTIKDVQWSPFLGGYILSILTAILATLAAAGYVSRQPYSLHLFSRMVLNPLLIFVAGVFGGVLVNFIYQGLILNPEAGFSENFYDWFTKPFYWLMLIGGPSSIVVGLIYYPLSFVLEKMDKKN